MNFKTVILLWNFSFGLINFVNLSTTFFIQRFLKFFYFFIKNAFLTFFILGVNVFIHVYAVTHHLIEVLLIILCIQCRALPTGYFQ